MDRLSPLFVSQSPTAQVFFTGTLCTAVDIPTQAGAGVLHLLKQGRLRISPAAEGKDYLDGPCLLFYPRPYGHRFEPDPAFAPELACASIRLGEPLSDVVLASLPEGLVLPLADLPEMQATLTVLFAEGMGQLCGRKAILDRLFEVAVIMLLRALMRQGSIERGVLAGLADPQLARAITAMHRDAARSWTLETLAEAAAMSRTGFAVRFKARVGTTPLDYLTRWRLALATTQLAAGRSVKSVATAVGYRSAAAFARAFAARYGQSPGEWRPG